VQRGYDEDWLGDTFSRAVLLGNGLIAILSGLLANALVDTFSLGPVAPFDAAAVILFIGGAMIFFTWKENYGDRTPGQGLMSQFQGALEKVTTDVRVLLLGVMQVCLLLLPS
jgi:MFS transporter, MFS domain-containing protein family, molybdate-anion transporter